VTNDTPTDTPLTPLIALVKTAVGGTGIGDNYLYFCSNQYREHYPYECNRNRPNGGLTITGNPIATLAVGANSTIKGTYTITQADIDAGSEHGFSYSERSERKCVTDISGTHRDNDTPTDTPLTQTPHCSCENSCSRWNRKSR
jgi:hypothetical protein